jgi:hypothetical protein
MPPVYGNTVGSSTTMAYIPQWYIWCDQTATYSTAQIWTNWCETGTTITLTSNYVEPHQPTPEEIEAQRVAAAEAVKRAHDLFMSLLDEEQKASYLKDAVVHVTSSRNRRYRIHCRSMVGRDRFGMGNLDLLDESGEVKSRLCAHPTSVPDPDIWAAQFLALQTDEDTVVRTANIHYGERPELVAA